MNIKRKISAVTDKDVFFRLAPKRKKRIIADILKHHEFDVEDEVGLGMLVGCIYECSGFILNTGLVKQLHEHYQGEE